MGRCAAMSTPQEPQSPERGKTDTRRFGRLWSEAAKTTRVWTEPETAAVLAHQLSAPVVFDLGGLNPTAAAWIGRLAAAEGLLIRSFRDLFLHPQPPVDLLRLTKEFAKAHLSDPESPLPREVAMVLYYASIAAALLHGRPEISRLPASEIRLGARWALDRSWLDPDLRRLFESLLTCPGGITQAHGVA
jgi:hypothetical protein